MLNGIARRNGFAFSGDRTGGVDRFQRRDIRGLKNGRKGLFYSAEMRPLSRMHSSL
jgi:hypothetical protein